MRVAFSSIDWNTGSKSSGKLLMTCSTSEVALCCSKASFSVPARRDTSSRALTRVSEYGDRREWTLNGLLSGTHRGTETIVRNKGSDKLVRLNTVIGPQVRRCPRHHTPNAMTTANASVNQVTAYCR